MLNDSKCFGKYQNILLLVLFLNGTPSKDQNINIYNLFKGMQNCKNLFILLWPGKNIFNSSASNVIK